MESSIESSMDMVNIYSRKGREQNNQKPKSRPIPPSLSQYKKDYLKEAEMLIDHPIGRSIDTITNTDKQSKASQTSQASKTSPVGSAVSAGSVGSVGSAVPLSAQHLKISVRLPRGIVTSLTLKKNILVLWILYTADPDLFYIDIIGNNVVELQEEHIKKDKDAIWKLINDFVYKCLDNWSKETGRGLSDYITECMIEDFLDDYEIYEKLLPLI